MTDFLGQEINVGDRIVYPNRVGAALWMNKGVVNRISEKGLHVTRVANDKWEKPLSNVVITVVNRVTVVPSANF